MRRSPWLPIQRVRARPAAACQLNRNGFSRRCQRGESTSRMGEVDRSFTGRYAYVKSLEVQPWAVPPARRQRGPQAACCVRMRPLPTAQRRDGMSQQSDLQPSGSNRSPHCRRLAPGWRPHFLGASVGGTCIVLVRIFPPPSTLPRVVVSPASVTRLTQASRAVPSGWRSQRLSAF